MSQNIQLVERHATAYAERFLATRPALRAFLGVAPGWFVRAYVERLRSQYLAGLVVHLAAQLAEREAEPTGANVIIDVECVVVDSVFAFTRAA